MSLRGVWPRPSLTARLLSRYVVDEQTGCWIWLGGTNAEGYGLILPNGSDHVVRAHRVSYALFVGPIPEGFTVDHTCHNADAECPGGKACLHRRCINPAHLEAVERGENVRRGSRRIPRTHCRYGHELTPENTYVRVRRGYEHRECRACHREQANARYHARKVAA